MLKSAPPQSGFYSGSVLDQPGATSCSRERWISRHSLVFSRGYCRRITHKLSFLATISQQITHIPDGRDLIPFIDREGLRSTLPAQCALLPRAYGMKFYEGVLTLPASF
jgi:hypothetical protein